MTLDELRSSGRAVITVTEAASLLDVSKATAYQSAESYLRTGVGLPCRRVGVRRLVVPVTALLRWLEWADQ